MSKPRPERLLQTILDGPNPELLRPISTITLSDADLRSPDALKVFDHAEPLGISPGFDDRGYLVALAIADSKECRIIEFQVNHPRRGKDGNPPSPEIVEGRKMLSKFLCRESGDLFAFDLGPLALSLHKSLAIRLSSAIDIQSCFSAIDRKPISAIEVALGESVRIKQENVRTLFMHPVYHGDRPGKNDLFMRAWISQFLASFGNGILLFEKAKRIDTRKFSDQQIAMIGKVATDSTRRDHMKPQQTVHRITQISSNQTGNGVDRESVGLRSNDFATRMRDSGRTVQINSNTDLGPIVSTGVVGKVRGRTGYVSSTNNIQLVGTEVMTVTSIGRDDPTTAEAKRAAVILRILQGDRGLLEDSPWVRNMWFNTEDNCLSWPEDWSRSVQRSALAAGFSGPTRTLNSSQQKAVNAMLSQQDKHRITIIQGPPGTGKTTVISSFVEISVKGYNREGIWLIAQSNVAVKNIAEKLTRDNFEDWKLLVSKDFIFDWHDHLYEKIKSHIIPSDEFKKYKSSKLKGIHVMLSTLSMLSNPHITTFTKAIPFYTLIIDEASQIEIGDYIPIFSSFNNSLRKICFIGDDKQLPPFGQEDLQDLQSIFEITHLRKQALFLDTQYRMPPQIGDIISEAIYNAKLKSDSNHPVTEKTACYFIDIPNGKEKQYDKSFMNEFECQAILKLARKLQDNGKSYRIITPYEAQRNHIELSMKAAELEWSDTCFNVDSFQGNEEDYIVISVVRNREIGFLKNLRRTNVMLTRCKKGMFIFSSKHFLTGPGAETLVGTLLEKLGGSWLAEDDIEERDLF